MSTKCQNCDRTTFEVRVCKKCGFSGCNSCFWSSCPKCHGSSSNVEKIRV